MPFCRRARNCVGSGADWRAPKAITACTHKLARIVYNVMRYGAEYAKRSEAEFAAEQRTRLEKSLHRRAKEMGFEFMKPYGEVLIAALPPDLLLNA